MQELHVGNFDQAVYFNICGDFNHSFFFFGVKPPGSIILAFVLPLYIQNLSASLCLIDDIRNQWILLFT